VQFRIETVDATTGKPTGTLYDANAVINVTPALGIQTYTFATLPTTGLIVGNEYAVVALTTVAGTTQTIRSSVTNTGYSKYPTIVLTAADGTTRTNFAEVGGSVPCLSLVNESNIDQAGQFAPFSTTVSNAFFGANTWASSLITISNPIKVASIRFQQSKAGTPAGDIRIRILDRSNNLIPNSTLTIDKDSLLTASTSRGHEKMFPTIISLPAGTYRVVFDSATSVDSSNCFNLSSGTFLNANAVSSGHRLSTSTDGGVTWTDSTTDQAAVWLGLDDLDSVKRARFIHQ
jgi:hypothetical protein